MYAVITLELMIFSYKFHLISSTYSHQPEMFIILLQPLHPLVIHFDFIWCNRFGAHKLIRVSTPFATVQNDFTLMAWCWIVVAPLLMHWSWCSLALPGPRLDVHYALCRSCKNYAYHWRVSFLCFNELMLRDYSAISHWFCICLCVTVAIKTSWILNLDPQIATAIVNVLKQRHRLPPLDIGEGLEHSGVVYWFAYSYAIDKHYGPEPVHLQRDARCPACAGFPRNRARKDLLEAIFGKYWMPHIKSEKVMSLWQTHTMGFYQNQVKFVVWYARTGCGISWRDHLEIDRPLARSVFGFHIYYLVHRILIELQAPLPQDQALAPFQNLYDSRAYEPICREFSLDP